MFLFTFNIVCSSFSSDYTETCVIDGNMASTSLVYVTDWDNERNSVTFGLFPYLAICRLSAVNGISLPFVVYGSHSADSNDDSIDLNKLAIEITDGTTTIEISYDPSNDNSPLLNTSPILGSDTTETSFTLNGGKYKLSVTKDKFEMQFSFEDENSNSIDAKFLIQMIGNDDNSYDMFIIQTTDSLSGYLCGTCGEL